MTATAATPFRYSAPPTALSRFVGREREVSTVAGLLRTTRLLTLTGAGGSGKTRLATETVLGLADAWDSIVWIDLAALQEARNLTNHVAAGFGLSERADETALDGIRTAVGPTATLLVLDNCEHVIEASARLADALLREIPHLSILATSREVLGVQGETGWLVPPLVPTEAIELFTERAQAALPSFAVTPNNAQSVTEICRRLDGIPLAIELAAARVKVIGVDQIVSRLSDALKLLSSGGRTTVPRHRTLRATIEWSHSLLTYEEQVLLRRLSYFPASFALEAAEAVGAGEGLDATDVLDTLTGLVDKSLVMLDANETAARYRLLETMRQFGAEQLAAHGEAEATAARHTRHFLSLADATAPHIVGGASDPKWMLDLLPDLANLRAAVEWASGAPERYEVGLRLIASLDWFWWARGPFEEVRRFERALDADVPVSVRIRGMIAFGRLHMWQGRPLETLAMNRRALALLTETDDVLLRIDLRIQSGAMKLMIDQVADGIADIDAAIELAEGLPLHILLGIGLHFRGMARMARGDMDGAIAAHAQEVEVSRHLGHLSGMTHSATAIANIHYLQGRVAEALGEYRESLTIAARASDGWGIAKGLEGVATCVTPREPALAARLLAAADAFRERIANPLWPDERARVEPALAQLRATLGGQFDAEWQAGRLILEREAISQALRTEADAGVAAKDSAMRDTAQATRVASHAPSAPGGTSPGGAATAATSATGTSTVNPTLRRTTAREANAPTADLVLNTLGRFEAIRIGERIEAAAWGSARPRELLVYFACHPKGVTKEQAGLALWPDASPTQVRNNFHVTVHRLRKTLGEGEWITTADDRYAIAASRAVEFDVALFEHEIDRGLALAKRGDGTSADLLARALARYGGPFLDGDTVGDWALDLRDRLVRRFVDGSLAFARTLLTQRPQPEQTIAVLRAVIAADHLVEDAWALLMRAYAQRGDRAQALKLYQQLDAILLADLDTSPSQATQELRAQIERGDVS